MFLKVINIKIVIIIVSCIFLFLKFFTIQVSYLDEPTVGIIVKSFILTEDWQKLSAHSNSYKLNGDDDMSNYITLIRDENGYIGEEIYAMIVTWLWFVFPLVAAISMMILRNKKGRSYFELTLKLWRLFKNS